MQNDTLTLFRAQIMKAADLMVIAIAVTVFAATMLTGSMIDSYVAILGSGDLSGYGHLRAKFDAGTVKAFLGMTSLILAAMALVYWGIRRAGPIFGRSSDLVALGWFFLLAFLSIPSGMAYWLLSGFDVVQFAPSRFLAFQAEIDLVFNTEATSTFGHWMIIVAKSAMAITLPALYLSTFRKPLRPIKTIRIA